MGFHIVDIILVSLVLFLAIKGLMNGFSKELFSFLTIVGGVALAARFNTTVVELINEQKIAPHINDAYAKIIGFVVIVITVWLLLGVISSIITKLTSGTSGFISRFFGYLLSLARYTFIFSLIVFGVSQSDFFKDEAEKLQKETKLFVPMTNIGAKLLNIDLNNSDVSKASEEKEPVETPTESTETETTPKEESSKEEASSDLSTSTTTEKVEVKQEEEKVEKPETEIETETKTEVKAVVENAKKETTKAVDAVKALIKSTEENLSIDPSTLLVDHNNSI